MAPRQSDEFKRDAVRFAQTSGLTMRQVASDLEIGLSTLGKWVRSIAEEAKVYAFAGCCCVSAAFARYRLRSIALCN